ncbi:MAG: hypothetical protein C0410_09175 [Anaerolinea sp.]|nr:hypothetical protein [Anaerolinea sp.]
MRFFIADYYYQDFLDNFYTRHPNYAGLDYEQAWRVLMDEQSSLGDAYSSALKQLGHEAETVVINEELLQKKWAVENGIYSSDQRGYLSNVSNTLKRLGRQILKSAGPWGDRARQFIRQPVRRFSEPWLREILAAQIKKYHPDVFLNGAIRELDAGFLKEIQPFAKLIVCQHASPLPPNVPYGSYDLFLSSLPNQVDYFRSQGVNSEHFRLGFNEAVLARLKRIPNAPQVVHSGSYGPVHNERNELLEKVARQVHVDFWGVGIENLSKDSLIRRTYHGEAWGMDRNNIFHNSRITLTKHITSVAGRYANNQTLYEATGVGALLVTDMRDNLSDLFEVGKEVVAYHDADECIALVKHCLDHEEERAAIAHAGQQRTLQEHTYDHRMQELVDIVSRYLP